MRSFLLLALAGGSSPAAPTRIQTPPPAARQATPADDAIKLFNAGRYADAEAQLVAILERDANNATLWNLLGRARFARKRYDTAQEAFARARTLLPDDNPVRNNFGAAAFFGLRYDEAQRAFRDSVAREPADSMPHMFLGRIAEARGDSEGAEREFLAAVRGTRVDALAPFYFGLFLTRERRIEEARAAFENALALNPDFAGAHLNLALVLRRLGQEEPAQRHMDRFRELSEVVVGDDRKRLRVTDCIRRAQAEIQNGNYGAALVEALDANEIGSEYPAVHGLLAQIYRLLGQTEEAAREEAEAYRLAEQHK